MSENALTTPSTRTSAPTDRAEVRQALQAFIDKGFAGMQIRIRDHRGDWTASAGVRELGLQEPPSTDGLFRIGSATKTFVSAVVLQLVDEGLIGLDEPIAGHLTRFDLDPRITVRMLLQHTSGVFNFTGEYYPDGTVVEGIPWQGPEWVAERFHSYRPEELVEFALSKPARFEPGTDWSYANTNYVLASLLIHQLTGRPYGEELDRRVMQPLGLTDTRVPGSDPEIHGPHAHGYHRYQDGDEWKVLDVSRQDPSWVGAGGEMVSSTKDLAAFISALMSGKLVPDHLLAEMRAPYPTAPVPYGLGLFEQDLGDGRGTVYHHNGSVNGYATLMYATPDGGSTLTGSLTTGDADINAAAEFPPLLDDLLKAVFPGEREARG
ncbi:serine hydrolase domain-containing protein [Streptomyces sp. NPDC001941]|uniref:serine hydrolase domain-containing protein n=1 Tax=Streptomyces sp. NPDC001941 TaxID=3154659 RepID=UPI003320ECC5